MGSRAIGILAAIGAVGFSGVGASAQVMTYTLDGGTSRLSGSVGSVTFTNETWNITATADASLAQWVNFNGVWPTNYLLVTPVLNVAGNSFSFLPTTSGHSWAVASQSAPGSSVVGFMAFDTVTPTSVSNSFTLMHLLPGSLFYVPLNAPVVLSGSPLTMFANNPGPNMYLTNAGLLSLSVPQPMMNSGSFSITSSAAVPEPGEWAAMGILGAGLAGLVLRRRWRQA